MLHVAPSALRPRLVVLASSLLFVACVDAEEAELDTDADAEFDTDTDDGEHEADEGDDAFRAAVGAYGTHFELVRDDSQASRATGSVAVPLRVNGQLDYEGGWIVRGTCGVTFISPHYAVTSAHCVTGANVPNPQVDSVVVKTYDTSDVSGWSLLASSIVEGTFPEYWPQTPAYQLPGYSEQGYVCTVVSRCGEFGDASCTAGGNTITGDVALVYCGGRSSSAAWLPVATSDDPTGPVEMYWFHELLYMPTTLPQAGTSERERWDHYTILGNDRSQNFHYLEHPGTGLLPLKSKSWAGGVQRRRLGSTWTDLYGCHGTSGSGVLQRNGLGNLELLGPAKSASARWNGRLCDDPATLTPGVSGINYESNTHVLALQAAFAGTLFWDRFPIIWWNPGNAGLDPG